jgi:hypothetical protein
VKSKENIMTTSRAKKVVSKYVAGMEYIKNVCGKSGGNIIQKDFRETTKLTAIAIKGMVELGYIKKIRRGFYAWNLGDIVEPKAARKVHEYVLNYFRDNVERRANIVPKPRQQEENLMEQELIPSTPEQDVEAMRDWVNDLLKKQTELLIEIDGMQGNIDTSVKWIDELRNEIETWRNMYDDAVEELTEMKDNHNAIVNDIMESPFIEPEPTKREPSSKIYYLLGLPILSIKIK